jgi:hypothetical protein
MNKTIRPEQQAILDAINKIKDLTLTELIFLLCREGDTENFADHNALMEFCKAAGWSPKKSAALCLMVMVNLLGWLMVLDKK